jgi:O-antigen ligase
VSRVSFPFSVGFNTYGTIVGILLTLGLFGTIEFDKYRKAMLLGVVLSTWTLLLTDTRSALFYPYLIFFAHLLFTKRIKRPKLLWIIPGIAAVGPLVFLSVLTLISQIPEISFLSRSSEDLATANSRSLIWFNSSLEFLDFKLLHLIGYGEFGHYESGASKAWGSIFSQWGEAAKMIHPHSIVYSTLFDYGYIGLAVLLTLQFKLIRIIERSWETNRKMCVMSVAFLLYWNLVGITETFTGFYTPNILTLFVTISVLVFQMDRYRPKVGRIDSLEQTQA